MGKIKNKKNKHYRITSLDALKAMRKGNREAEMERLGPGFHSHDRAHKSDKIYTRKKKHKEHY